MSYDAIKEQGSNPPNYPYLQPSQDQQGTTPQKDAAASPLTQHYDATVPAGNGNCMYGVGKDDTSTGSVEHLNLDFKECFREHKSTKTVEQYYQVLDVTYKYTKLITYHFFVFVFGIFLAIAFAFVNGLMSFLHVWIYWPLAKVFLLWLYAIAPVISAPIKALFTPIVDMHARIFRQIKIQANLSGSLPHYYSNRRSNV